MRYYYDPLTGIFKFRSNYPMDTDLPYIEREDGWLYSDYRVDVPFDSLIYDPQPKLDQFRR